MTSFPRPPTRIEEVLMLAVSICVAIAFATCAGCLGIVTSPNYQ